MRVVLNLKRILPPRHPRAGLRLAVSLMVGAPLPALAQEAKTGSAQRPAQSPGDAGDGEQGPAQPTTEPDAHSGSEQEATAPSEQDDAQDIEQGDAQRPEVAQDVAAGPKPDASHAVSVSGEPLRTAKLSPAPLLPETGSKALPNAGYDGGFFIQSDDGDYKLIVGGRVTARLTMSGQELDGVPGATPPPDEIAFSIPRAWIKLTGNLFTPDLTYRVYVDFGRGGVPELFDAFVNHRFIEDWLEVRVGQWRMPWTRQFINNIPWMSFQERSILMNPFDAGRDIGVIFHNDYDGAAPAFEYAVGAVNGSGITANFDTSDPTLTNADATNIPERFDPTVLLRAAYNHNGGTRYREIDIEGDDLRFSVGAGSRLRFEVAEDDGGYAAFGVDGALQAWGFSAVAELLVRLDQDGGRWSDLAYQRLGFTGQAGYTIDKILQPSLRYSYLDEDAGGDRHAFYGGLTVLPYENPLFRVMVEGGAVLTDVETGRQTDWLLRQQAIIDF